MGKKSRGPCEGAAAVCQVRRVAGYGIVALTTDDIAP
jgi:hypothetical protein